MHINYYIHVDSYIIMLHGVRGLLVTQSSLFCCNTEQDIVGTTMLKYIAVNLQTTVFNCVTIHNA